MTGFTIVHMDDFERPFPKWALARKSLGLQSFGMNVVELPPGESIPEHTEVESDQEEVFIILSGEATMVIDGVDHPAPAGTFARLDPEPRRTVANRSASRRHVADRLRPADERLHAAGLGVMRAPVTAACVQVEPAIFDRAGTIDRVAERTAEAAAAGAGLVVFPETFIPAYPSSVWAKALAGWGEPGAKEAFALLHRESLELPGPDADRLAGIAREHGAWLVIGVNEVDPARPGTLYNSLLYYSPAGELALHHRKLVPTNHERLVWGPGDGRGLRAIETPIGRLGGLICWENYMPLARFSLYESGIEIYIASTADDGDSWQATLRHIALESRTFVIAPCHFQRASSYPDDFPLASLLEGRDILGRGGSAILGPDGSYLAGPLYDEEGILYAELDPELLLQSRQRFDPAGHYHRPDVLTLTVTPL